MSLNFRLAELLAVRYRQLNEIWRAVERDIAKKDPKGKTLDRRKLAKLAACDESVRLSIEELRRLQNYVVALGLVRHHENPFFTPSANLLDGLRAEHDVTVFYPSRPLKHFNTEAASRWDLRAIQVLNGVPEINCLNFSFHDVYHLGPDHANANQLRESQELQPWHKVLDEERALISIGAPFACYATEEILCRMFNVEPYAPHGLDTDKPLPFYLYWPASHRPSDSAFAVSAGELEKHYPDAFSKLEKDSRAVLIGGELYPAPKYGESLNLIVAQYWRGHLVMVLLGVYAPSTLSIAHLVAERKITESLGPYRYNKSATDTPWESQPILINKIRTTISRAERTSHWPYTDVTDDRQTASVDPVGWERWQWSGEQFAMSDSGSYPPTGAG